MSGDEKPKGERRSLLERIAEIDERIVELQRDRLRLVHYHVAEQCRAVPHLRYLGRVIKANWQGGYGDKAIPVVAEAEALLASYNRGPQGPLPAAGSPELHDALAPEDGTAERVAERLGLREDGHGDEDDLPEDPRDAEDDA